jgi:hypothetical protein
MTSFHFLPMFTCTAKEKDSTQNIISISSEYQY